MDPKASAKSKRTHTIHGRRNHPTPSAAAAARKHPSAAGTSPPRRATLPSNWDRYDTAADDPIPTADLGVTVKSKGADFRYLLDEARSGTTQQRGVGPDSSLFGQLVSGFQKGASSILSVRGENLLTWCGDDNFIVDDHPASSYEVPFLTMDLHALAAQLSKLKLSERLFIEADLLPEEYGDQPQKSEASEEQPEPSEFRESSTSQGLVGDSRIGQFVHSQGNVCRSSVQVDNRTLKSLVDVPFETIAAQTAKPVSNIDLHKPEASGSRKAEDITPVTNATLESKWDMTSRLEEVGTAEVAIDMLLESFGQSGLSSSQEGSSTNNRFGSQRSSLPSSYPLASGLVNASSNPRHSVLAASLDDSIDLLLEETSSVLGEKNHIAQSRNESTMPRLAPVTVPAPPKPIDDFDSWFDTL